MLIDSHSKWIEVEHMRSTTTTKTLEVLRAWFARFGLPEECCTDNGPQFTSEEFAVFMKQNGIKHTLVPPYHPASNGAAERSVQILKQALAKEEEKVKRGAQKRPIQHVLANFLMQYRSTPHSVTGQTPAELFLGRKTRTRFSNLLPNLEEHMKDQQGKQQRQHDRSRVKGRELNAQDTVQVRNHNPREASKWLLGTVVHSLGPLTYLVRVGRQLRHVHIDDLLKTNSLQAPQNETDSNVNNPVLPPPIVMSQDATPSPKLFVPSVVSTSAGVATKTPSPQVSTGSPRAQTPGVTPTPKTPSTQVSAATPKTPIPKTLTPKVATPKDTPVVRRQPFRMRMAPQKLDL